MLMIFTVLNIVPLTDVVLLLPRGVYCLLLEFCNVLYGKLGVLSCWVGMPKGHSTNKGGDCLHIGDPRECVLYNMASTHHSHHEFNNHFWLHELQRHLKGGHRQWVPLQAGCYLIKAWGGATMYVGSGDLGEGGQLYLQLLFHPLVSSSPHLRALMVVPSLCFPKG